MHNPCARLRGRDSSCDRTITWTGPSYGPYLIFNSLLFWSHHVAHPNVRSIWFATWGHHHLDEMLDQIRSDLITVKIQWLILPRIMNQQWILPGIAIQQWIYAGITTQRWNFSLINIQRLIFAKITIKHLAVIIRPWGDVCLLGSSSYRICLEETRYPYHFPRMSFSAYLTRRDVTISVTTKNEFVQQPYTIIMALGLHLFKSKDMLVSQG